VSTTTDQPTGTMIEVEGQPTYFHQAGDGPPLLLVHGSGPGVSAWANWRLVMPKLAEHFQVIAYDQIGFNKTMPVGDVEYGRQTWTRHGLALMETLGIESFDVIGNSMGGAVALSMVAERPEAIGRIAVMGTMGVPGPIPPGLDQVWGYTPSEENMRRTIQLLSNDPDVATPELVRLRHEASVAPGIDEAWQAMFPAPRQRWMDDLALSPDELGSIEQKVLLVHGYEDRVIPFQGSLTLMDLIPDVRLHVFGKTGHWVQIERTDEFIRLMVDFFTA
jgi:2-hydroxymuconate-semialdehyde hydrolase